VLNPEQVVLNFAFILSGLAGMFTIDGSLIEEWQPPLDPLCWSLMMMTGGACVLWGIFKRHSTLERLGYLLTGPRVCVVRYLGLDLSRLARG
jgi:hypothetical protein